MEYPYLQMALEMSKINLKGLEDYTVDSEDEGDPFSDEDDVEDPSVG